MSLLYPAYSFVENSLNSGPILNSRKNIISGPGQGDYWFHSRGLEVPDTREEGPFPITGNIGALLKQEANYNFSRCSDNISVGGGPNCTGVFTPDIFSYENTCGSNCKLSIPESFGMQSFGMNEDKLTSIHGLHSYKNIRAANPGQGPSSSYGCNDWLPPLKKTEGNSCELDFSSFSSNTVGNWTPLKQSRSFIDYTFNPKF